MTLWPALHPTPSHPRFTLRSSSDDERIVAASECAAVARAQSTSTSPSSSLGRRFSTAPSEPSFAAELLLRSLCIWLHRYTSPSLSQCLTLSGLSFVTGGAVVVAALQLLQSSSSRIHRPRRCAAHTAFDIPQRRLRPSV